MNKILIRYIRTLTRVRCNKLSTNRLLRYHSSFLYRTFSYETPKVPAVKKIVIHSYPLRKLIQNTNQIRIRIILTQL